ncbi:MAG: NUDIX hydrolase [Porticoccaceae bacterium]|nr:NUDIX hydrolase [Porticoccaceae bacterium]
MKYCSNCGNAVVQEIPLGDNRQRYVCHSCDFIHYQNPRVIVGVLPVYEEKILLCRRAIEPRLGLWTLPAGFLENGESTLEGALRECYEESYATVVEPHLYALFDIPQIHQVYVFYRAKMQRPEYAVSSESSEVALFSEDQIPWDELAFPVVERTLLHFLEDRKAGLFNVKHEQIQKPWKSTRSN